MEYIDPIAFNVLIEHSSLPDELKEEVRRLRDNGYSVIELPNGQFMDLYLYLTINQLEPITQRSPKNQREINKVLDIVLQDG